MRSDNVDLETAKGFLRVDFDDDDDLINLLIEVATEYITAAVGSCDYEESARVRLLAMVIITELYETRSMTTDKMSQKTQHTIRSIIAQLQAESELKNEA